MRGWRLGSGSRTLRAAVACAVLTAPTLVAVAVLGVPPAGAVVYSRQTVYVGDQLGGRVDTYSDTSGVLSNAHSFVAFSNMSDMAADAAGNTYVASSSSVTRYPP